MARSRIEPDGHVPIPVRVVGPLVLAGPVCDGPVRVPLATFEKPLWPSVERGAAVTARSSGITVCIADDRMTRSVLLEAPSAVDAVRFVHDLRRRRDELAAEAESTSRFARLLDLRHQIAGNLVFLRLEMSTGDAAGHNMVTLAAEAVLRWLAANFPALEYVSISGNYCADKKVSAVNGILGRGKHVIAEARIPAKLCRRFLKTTPARIAALNRKKNLVGSILAGSVRSANAHFANMLLAFYLATGQDAANIVEGSQGLVLAEERDDELYFACDLPNVIVGTVGNGKDHPIVRQHLELLGCTDEAEPGANARRLAAICGAVVLCGELSLLAAQSNPGELMQAHEKLERRANE